MVNPNDIKMEPEHIVKVLLQERQDKINYHAMVFKLIFWVTVMTWMSVSLFPRITEWLLVSTGG